MNPGGSWKRFESSGRITDYLAYKSEESDAARREEWDAYNDDDDGAGAARDEDGRG
jgi:hypothetical protein